MSGENYQVSQEQLLRLRDTAGTGPVLILTHENPDPDALASGKTLAVVLEGAWGVQSRLIYSGLVGRAENKAMLNLLTPEWEHEDILVDLDEYSAIALVDTQPGTGNNRLPAALIPDIVFDHHRRVPAGLDLVDFVEIRPEIGSTVSLVYLYLEAAGIEPDPTLANAIFYGIQTDTRGLSRGHSPVDKSIYFKLLHLIDRSQLQMVEQAKLPRAYFRALNHGLHASQIFGQAMTAYLGEMHRPDFMADMAEILARLEQVRAVLCMGYHGGKMYLSLRVESDEIDAALLIQNVVLPPGKAGGHGNSAGGQIPLEGKDAAELAEIVQKRFISLMGETFTGEMLL